VLPHLLISNEARSPWNFGFSKNSVGVGLQEASSSSKSSNIILRNSSLYIQRKAPRFLKNDRFRACNSWLGVEGTDAFTGLIGVSSSPEPARGSDKGAGAELLSALLLLAIAFPNLLSGEVGGDIEEVGLSLRLDFEDTDGKVGTEACFVRTRCGLPPKLEALFVGELLLLGLLGLLLPHLVAGVDPAGLFFSPIILFQKPSMDSEPALR
jgi:hypothetical protein